MVDWDKLDWEVSIKPAPEDKQKKMVIEGFLTLPGNFA